MESRPARLFGCAQRANGREAVMRRTLLTGRRMFIRMKRRPFPQRLKNRVCDFFVSRRLGSPAGGEVHRPLAPQRWRLGCERHRGVSPCHHGIWHVEITCRRPAVHLALGHRRPASVPLLWMDVTTNVCAIPSASLTCLCVCLIYSVADGAPGTL